MNIFPIIALSPVWPARLTWHFIPPLLNHLFTHSLLVKTLTFFPVIYNSLLSITDGQSFCSGSRILVRSPLPLPYFPAHQEVLGPPYLSSRQLWNKSFLSRALFLLVGPALDTKLGIWMSWIELTSSRMSLLLDHCDGREIHTRVLTCAHKHSHACTKHACSHPCVGFRSHKGRLVFPHHTGVFPTSSQFFTFTDTAAPSTVKP